MSTRLNDNTAASTAMEELPLHAKAECDVEARPLAVFEHIDNPERLSAHMARRSWQLMGTSMSIDTDADGGRRVGSHIRLTGRALGIPLFIEGVVVLRKPPKFKAWETVGEPHLLVIGRYRMSVSIEGRNTRSRVRVAIDYALPSARPWRWLGEALASMYARWCMRQMVRYVVRQFGR
jgi:hypothetical protein